MRLGRTAFRAPLPPAATRLPDAVGTVDLNAPDPPSCGTLELSIDLALVEQDEGKSISDRE
jgi:hypothetical protein